MSARVHALEGGGEIELISGWLSPVEAVRAMSALSSEIDWKQERIRLMGRDVLQPRLTAWYGDPDAVYTYSGLTNAPRPWLPMLLEWRARLEREIGRPFNAVLANLYRDEHDSMGWHSDNERELGPDPVVASVSLGTPRRFVLKHKRKKDVAKLVFDLGEGTLLVMRRSTQHAWKHAVPRESSARGARINLTYRHVSGSLVPSPALTGSGSTGLISDGSEEPTPRNEPIHLYDARARLDKS